MRQRVLWTGCDPARARPKASRAARDFVARLRGWADQADAEVARRSGDEAAALEDVAEELRALALVVEAARAGRLPDGVLRVAGESRRAAALRRRRHKA